MSHPIELEVRAEILPTDREQVARALERLGFVQKNSTRRTMLMSFGRISRIAEDEDQGTAETDIRCRVTNGSAEVVVKIGGVHAHDRKEISTSIEVDVLPAFARVIGALNMFHKVGSRITTNYTRGEIVASIVASPSGIAYLELEKMSDETRAEQDRAELETLAHELKVTLLPGREAFIDLCNRLTEQDDWRFSGSEEEIVRFLEEAHTTGALHTDGGK